MKKILFILSIIACFTGCTTQEPELRKQVKLLELEVEELKRKNTDLSVRLWELEVKEKKRDKELQFEKAKFQEQLEKSIEPSSKSK